MVIIIIIRAIIKIYNDNHGVNMTIHYDNYNYL